MGAREQALTNSLDKSDRFITTEIFHTSANNRESNRIHSSNSLNRIPHRYNLYPNNIGQASYFERNNPRDLQKLNKFLLCDQPHKSQYCRSVTNIQSRKKIIGDKKLCFKCLGSGHISKLCLSQIKCFKCGRHHHVALCIDTLNSNQQNQSHHNQSVGQLTSVAEVTSKVNNLFCCKLYQLKSWTTRATYIVAEYFSTIALS